MENVFIAMKILWGAKLSFINDWKGGDMNLSRRVRNIDLLLILPTSTEVYGLF